MKIVEITAVVTINGVTYNSGAELRVCEELFTDLVEHQKCAILLKSSTSKKVKKGK